MPETTSLPIVRNLVDFPLLPGCRAIQHGRTVFLYVGVACCAMADLPEREEVSAEAVWLRCPAERWKLVSDWHPWE
jgi:hypothetical protein